MQTSTSIIFQLTVTLRVKMGDTAEVQTFVNVLLNSRVLTAKNVGVLFYFAGVHRRKIVMNFVIYDTINILCYVMLKMCIFYSCL